tara:strand:- start:1468 stop:1731 length:264 start_codon:yes stop_codon:yes gene_type:complete
MAPHTVDTLVGRYKVYDLEENMKKQPELLSGDLVEIRSWRKNDSRLGVVVRPVRDSVVSGFSRYEILVENEVISIRRDMLQKVDKIK